MKMLSAVGRTIATPRVLPVDKKISLPVEKRISGSSKDPESKTFDFNILAAAADCSPRTPTSRRHSVQGEQSVTHVSSLKTPRVRKRPSMLSQSSSVSQQGQDDRQVDALVSAGVGSWAGSQAVGSFKTGAEGIVEPEELLTGLCPRSDQPQCGNIKEAHLREVENVVVDCDGLLFNVQESDGPKSCAENYVRKNVEFLNALADAGKRVVFCDSTNVQTRERFLEQLRNKGIKDDRSQVWTPACTAAWYLKSQGSMKPLIVSTQAAFVQEMRDLGFKDCLSILEESELIEELSVPDTAAGEDHLKAALNRLGHADAVVIGPLKDMSALMTALIDSTMDVVSEQSTWPMLVCCCPPRTRKKMKIMRNSVAGQRLLRPGVLHEEFIDAQWPSIMLSAALCDTQRFKPAETLMIGRSFEKSARFAYRAGMSCLLVLDTLEGQLQLTKEMRRECLPDYVAPSLGHVMGID